MTYSSGNAEGPMEIRERVWKLLETVSDPEIPVISVVDLGIVREVDVEDRRVTVTVTPTFSGCPAMHVIVKDIEIAVRAHDFEVAVKTVLYPPWSSDWISENGRQQLKDFGLSPPPKHSGRLEVTFYDLVACPYCGSKNSTLKNSFGPSLCRAIYYCNNCVQPFEQFKPL